MLANAPATTVLIARRTAAAVLNTFLLDTLGMGTMAERFNGDRDSDWAVIDISEIKALRHKKMVAAVYLMGERAVLVIPDARLLASSRHRHDFNPRDFGFGPQKMNWRKEKEPYEITVDIPQDIPGLMKRKKPEHRGLLADRSPKQMKRML